jgi:hypothetical protein
VRKQNQSQQIEIDRELEQETGEEHWQLQIKTAVETNHTTGPGKISREQKTH